jgi:tRNA pseudouridine38-40 synthase
MGDPMPEERNLKLVVSYLGAAYAGWQIQPRSPTVQGVLEAQISRMTGALSRVRGAGRTDAGVHALGQLANFRTASTVTARAFHRGLNALLPPDVAVLSVEEVPLEFDSRRAARGKHYRYTLWNDRNASPAMAATSLHIYRPLDVAAMALAARALVGTHDFAGFRASSCERETTVRTLHRCTVAKDGPVVAVDVEGTAFLRNMVRIIAGTLLEVGQGRRDPAGMVETLRSLDRKRAGVTAPAHGLCLVRVFL